MNAAILLAILTAISGFQVVRPMFIVNSEDNVEKFRSYIKSTKRDLQIMTLTLLIESIQHTPYIQIIFWIQKQYVQTELQRNLDTAMNRIRAHINAEKLKNNDVEHCYTGTTEYFASILHNATENFKTCAEISNTHIFVHEKFTKISEDIIEELNNVFSSCSIDYETYRYCLFTKIEMIKSKIDKFKILYNTRAHFRQAANQQMLQDSVQCFNDKYKLANEKITEALMSVKQCTEST
ncbi:hypothetical protein KM043_018604 [Ampulex compressa]|nr:hypothetical protein KM043_018604 [Ampulex compressa]